MTFKEPGFQEVIAQALAKMSSQSVAGTKEKVRKAGQQHDEDRETIDPKMVTELIIAVLRPRCVDAKSVQIQKDTREEVMVKQSFPLAEVASMASGTRRPSTRFSQNVLW